MTTSHQFTKGTPRPCSGRTSSSRDSVQPGRRVPGSRHPDEDRLCGVRGEGSRRGPGVLQTGAWPSSLYSTNPDNPFKSGTGGADGSSRRTSLAQAPPSSLSDLSPHWFRRWAGLPAIFPRGTSHAVRVAAPRGRASADRALAEQIGTGRLRKLRQPETPIALSDCGLKVPEPTPSGFPGLWSQTAALRHVSCIEVTADQP